jgi:putative ABC transport system permease protein
MTSTLGPRDRYFRGLLRFFPEDFRDEMGDSFVEAYRDRANAAAQRGGSLSVAFIYVRAFFDSLLNGTAERLRPSVMWRRSGNWGRDTELAFRRIVRAPVFTLSIVGTLAIGLGAFAVTAAVVNKVLLAPLPYKNPDDLYFAWRDYRAFFDLQRGWLGGPDIAIIAKAGGVIEDAAGLVRNSRTLTSDAAGADPMQIDIMATTPNFFGLLGVNPTLGRGFVPEEYGPKRPNVIVLTNALWRRLGARADIVGSQVRLSATPYTVIGVLPANFTFTRRASLGPPENTDAYIPLDEILADINPNRGSFTGLIRAKHGSSPAQVKAAIAQAGEVLDKKHFRDRGMKVWGVGFMEDLIGPLRPALLVLGAAGIVLVLVLMVNLGTLLLSRAAKREKEFAVSRALGASQGAVARATLMEGALLGTLGGVTAAVVAIWATKALAALAPADIPRREFIAMDWQTATLVVAVGAALGLIAALAPATWATRSSLGALLGNTNVRGGGGHGTMRRTMVVLQVALSLVLLSAGGLVTRSFARLLQSQPGFRSEGVLTLFVPIPSARVADSMDVLSIQERLVSSLKAISGVRSVSSTDALPLSAGANQTSISIPGAPGNNGKEDHDRPLVDVIGVRPDYFATMGIRMLAGRDFTPLRKGHLSEVVVDKVLADYFFPNGNALGARIPFGNPDTVTIVGVVQQARMYDISKDDRAQVYYRADENIAGTRSMFYVVHTDGDPKRLTNDVRRAIRDVDPQLAVAALETMEDLTSQSLSKQRVTAVLISGFALGGLLLAGMGLFGVVAGNVTRRRHELAVRIALGAEHGKVLREVIGEGAVLVGSGLVLAAPAVYWAGKAMAGILVGVSPHDLPTLLIVGGVLGAVALLACYLPARRVLQIDPAHALREE